MCAYDSGFAFENNIHFFLQIDKWYSTLGELKGLKSLNISKKLKIFVLIHSIYWYVGLKPIIYFSRPLIKSI